MGRQETPPAPRSGGSTQASSLPTALQHPGLLAALFPTQRFGPRSSPTLPGTLRPEPYRSGCFSHHTHTRKRSY